MKKKRKEKIHSNINDIYIYVMKSGGREMIRTTNKMR